MGPQIVSYGAGTNSTAMLIGLREHGERPDLVLFANTVGEKPHTYRHLWLVNEWCIANGFPPIVIVVGSQPRQMQDGSLENECLRLGVLPSKAMGFSSCSDKWKIDPQAKYVRRWLSDNGIATKPTKLIGFDVDEAHRADRVPKEAAEEIRRYPLIEWNWGREECVAAITRAGLRQPGKSACFFCPSSTKREILELRARYPELLARALKIEQGAIDGNGPAPALRSVKGLGRRFSWAEFLRQVDSDPEQVSLLSDAGTPEASCACYDG